MIDHAKIEMTSKPQQCIVVLGNKMIIGNTFSGVQEPKDGHEDADGGTDPASVLF